MKIANNDQRKIFDIQEEFNKLFPYLKVEFFSNQRKYDNESGKNFIKNNNITLSECVAEHTKGEISINAAMTVSDLERAFKEVFGLSIQVLRKSGKAWLETTVTDGWTLEEQNKQGEALSKP